MIQLIFSIDVKQECIPVGCVPSAAVAGGQGDVSAQGVSARHPPLWTEFLTHACENITFPQLRLRTVMTLHKTLHQKANIVHYGKTRICYLKFVILHFRNPRQKKIR